VIVAQETVKYYKILTSQNDGKNDSPA
jgi:hypothetical protein